MITTESFSTCRPHPAWSFRWVSPAGQAAERVEWLFNRRSKMLSEGRKEPFYDRGRLASRAVHSFLCSRITEVDLEIASLRWTDGPRTECQTSTENCQVFKTTRAMLQTSKTAARFSLPNVSRDERGINETVHVHICEQMEMDEETQNLGKNDKSCRDCIVIGGTKLFKKECP